MWVYDDGGRAEAGYRGEADDCVARATAIAFEMPYQDAYDEIAEACKAAGRPRSAREGVPTIVWRKYLKAKGWEYERLCANCRGTGRAVIPYGEEAK